MKDRDVDTHLTQYLPCEPAREAFRQQLLCDSTAEFVRVARRRSAWRRAELAAAAVLIAGVAFLGGRLSAPPGLPMTVAVAPLTAPQSDSVNVPSDLVAWLEAANLFRQLGMQDRMARAISRARSLLPADTATADSPSQRVFAAEGLTENGKNRMEPMAMPGPPPSTENVNQILAQTLGD